MIEEVFLQGADVCPDCETKLEGFKKYISEDEIRTEWVWMGWCTTCVRDKVTLHGNSPKEED